MPQIFRARSGVITYSASSSKTANLTGATINAGPTARGVIFYVDITVDGTFSQTFTVQSVDPVGGTFATLVASAAKTGVGTFYLQVGQDTAAVANVAAGLYLPRQFRLVTTGTITAATYSVCYELLD